MRCLYFLLVVFAYVAYSHAAAPKPVQRDLTCDMCELAVQVAVPMLDQDTEDIKKVNLYFNRFYLSYGPIHQHVIRKFVILTKFWLIFSEIKDHRSLSLL